MTEQSGGQTPAGWYPDGPSQLRYWDGTAWTEHVAPAVAPAQPAAETAAGPVAGPAADPASSRVAAAAGRRAATSAAAPPLYRRPVVILSGVVVLLLIAGLAVFALGGKKDGGSSAASAPTQGATAPGSGAATGPATVTQTIALNCQPSTFPVDKYSWALTLTVTPATTAGGPVTISAASTGSIVNTGPTVIQPGKYRFEATVTVNGTPLQLLGPLNKTKAAGAPQKQPIYPAAELPIVATGTTPAAPAGAALKVVLTDLYFNNINNPPTGDAKLTNTFDSRCNSSPQPNTAPVPIGLAVPPATVAQ